MARELLKRFYKDEDIEQLSSVNEIPQKIFNAICIYTTNYWGDHFKQNQKERKHFRDGSRSSKIFGNFWCRIKEEEKHQQASTMTATFDEYSSAW